MGDFTLKENPVARWELWPTITQSGPSGMSILVVAQAKDAQGNVVTRPGVLGPTIQRTAGLVISLFDDYGRYGGYWGKAFKINPDDIGVDHRAGQRRRGDAGHEDLPDQVTASGTPEGSGVWIADFEGKSRLIESPSRFAGNRPEAHGTRSATRLSERSDFGRLFLGPGGSRRRETKVIPRRRPPGQRPIRSCWPDCPNAMLMGLIDQFTWRTRRYELALMRERRNVKRAIRDHDDFLKSPGSR